MPKRTTTPRKTTAEVAPSVEFVARTGRWPSKADFPDDWLQPFLMTVEEITRIRVEVLGLPPWREDD